MNDNSLLPSTFSLRERLDRLEHELTGSALQKDDFTDALQDLRMSLEELEVAEEELIEQNQQLTESCAALEAERQRYIDLFEFAPDGYLVTDDRGKIKEANRAACDMIGGQARFLVGKPLSSFIDKQYLKTFRSELNRIKAASDVREMDLRLSPRDGPPFRAFIRVFASRIPDGKPSDFRWLLRDITKQKEADITDRNQAETSLRESQKQLASIIGSAMDAIITIDDDQRVVLFNAAAEEMFRCPADAAVGQPLDSFIPERFRSSYREHIRGFREASIISLSMGSDRAILGLRANGEEFPIEASISQVEVGSKKLLTVIIRDITSRRQAEDKLREQAALLDQAQDAIMVRDLEDHILFWSKGAERIYGWAAEEAVGKHIQDLHYKTIGQDYYEAKQSLLERGYWSSEGIHRTKNDNEIVVENRWSLLRDQEGNPESVLVINTDITEKKRLEEQFLRAQRMESIGMLAAGIAHDLGNILSPMLMAVDLLRLKFDKPERESFISIIERNGVRGAELLNQILGFARGVEEGPVVLQLRHVINEIETVIRETFPKTIEFESHLSENLWPIRGDATQLHQVLMNLCINARDAMLHGGKLTISVKNLEIDPVYAKTRGNVSIGRYILIEVADTGSGIAAEDLNKIFDPFFTTKAPGKGTGLGLTSVVDIIKGHRGLIDVESREGEGASFKLYIPAVDTGNTLQSELSQFDPPVGSGELILVVDDEATILEIIRKTLEVHGYRVLTADDGTDAISMFAQNKDDIDLVVLDMLMPHMDGQATIRTLKKIDPNVKIIMSSAYSQATDDIDSGEIKAVLVKPYSAQVLLTVLAKVLTESSGKRRKADNGG